jgi:hypothetical protein
MDEKTLQFLKSMREQGKKHGSREVYSADAARNLGMTPGSVRDREYKARLADLVENRYLEPHPDRSLTAQGVYLITAKGMARADEE